MKKLIKYISYIAVLTLPVLSCSNSKIDDEGSNPSVDTPYDKVEPIYNLSMNIDEMEADESISLSDALWYNKKGVKEYAARFDGNATYLTAAIDTKPLERFPLSISLWCAVQTYPMMNFGSAENLETYIYGNIQPLMSGGFAMTLSSWGDYGFVTYVDGRKVVLKASDKLQKGEWVHLNAVITESKIELYNNGEIVANAEYEGTPNLGKGELIIGKSFEEKLFNGSHLNVFNGLMDDFTIYSGEYLPEPSELKVDATPDFSPNEDRYDGDIQRPQLHPMPDMAWTNESHGLTYYNGMYHVFFQKNANGSYLSNIHWGHLRSEDLALWEEMPIAIAPDHSYDIKGTWSGCIWKDDEHTGGVPQIVYTSVDNAKASISMAYPEDDGLLKWTKYANNPQISGRPAGLSNDFRDPHMFKHNGTSYMIVGTGHGGVGATTLHRYDPASKKWSNTGEIFFKGESVDANGFFWEMPTIIKIKDDKWLFTATPLGALQGVEVQYWVGTINDDGTFKPLPQYEHSYGVVELEGTSRDGYGLLSPSVYRHDDGRVVAFGIVPDKLPAEYNLEFGWAHLYSFTREWSLDENDRLIQKPYETIERFRTNTTFSKENFDLTSSLSLAPVKGRVAELEAEFEIGDQNYFGFNLFKKSFNQVRLFYEVATNSIVLESKNAKRIVNDAGSFNGTYRSELPEKLQAGEKIKLHVFIDQSIIDVFINDKWAFSNRTFTTDEAATALEIFSYGGSVNVDYCNAWALERK